MSARHQRDDRRGARHSREGRRREPRPAASSRAAGAGRPTRARPTAPRRTARAGGVARYLGLALLAGLVGSAAVVPATMTAGAGVNAATDYWNALPTRLPDEMAPQRSTILAADGSKIAEFYSENRRNVTLDQVAPIARKAIVAIEDDRFYEHGPVDLRGTLRALVNNSGEGGRQGGSTLTQQYVKNVVLNAAPTGQKGKATELSLERKLREARLAEVAETSMTKDQILEGYLNIAYFGDGAYGIEMAAQHYFSIPAARLDLVQAATLAGLVQNPEGYAPTKHPKAATTRRNIVLGRMRETGVITAAEAAAARARPLQLAPSTPANGCITSRYPFYCQYVRDILAGDPAFGASPEERQQLLYRGGLTIKTHMQPSVMDAIQKVADEALGKRNEFATGIAVVEPGTGAVLGFAQNWPWSKTQVSVARGGFQTGSTFKAITYAAGLEAGFPVNGVLTAPEKFDWEGNTGKPITNDAKADVGTMDANTAMARSSNTWFAALEKQTGVLPTVAMANRLGLSIDPKKKSKVDYATTLGTDNGSPLEMASVYASLAAHGVVCAPVAIAGITNAEGKALDVPAAGCHQEIRPGIADAVTAALAQTVDGTDPARTGKGLSIGRPVAAKSGTTDKSAGVWFTGFTPQRATAVWIGDPAAPVRHPITRVRVFGTYRTGYGAAAAGPVWQAVMKAVTKELPVEQFSPVGPAEATGATGVVPDVRGLSTEQAIQVVHGSGLDVQIATAPAAATTATPPGVVVSQRPQAGSTIGLRGSITLTLSAGSDTTKAVPPRR